MGVGEALAVGESDVKTIKAEDEGALLGMGDGSAVGDTVGETVGVGDSVGVGSAVGPGVAKEASTVPIIGLRRSSASERGVIIKTQRTSRAIKAFLIEVSGVLATLERVMNAAIFIIFGRVLPEQYEVER
jgi:hypothetical protein